jgi:integrase
MDYGAKAGDYVEAYMKAAGVWVKPAARVKANREHRLPLSPQAVAELSRLPRTGPLVFTNSRGKPWTEVAAWPQIRAEAVLPMCGCTIYGTAPPRC